MIHTIRECLTTIGVTPNELANCKSLPEEFTAIKKAYFKKVLVCHPDKGGDAAVFRQVHASFEVLRDMYDNKKIVDSFATDSSTSADETAWQEYADMPTQSWDYFYTAAEEKDPPYRVEPAKSGRSSCKQKTKAKKCNDGEETIEKGEIRVGSMDPLSGGYGRWNHLKCWRVPSKVWLGLTDPDDPAQVAKALLSMNEVLLCGFSELSEEEKNAFVAHVTEKNENGEYANWAKLVKRKKKNDAALVAPETAQPSDSREVVPQGYHVPRRRFVPPVPGKDGAIAGALAGKTVVLTGIFPEAGGGSGLKLGCAKVKSMIESFGGRVTSSVSGKTDLLIVGKEPGRVKVQEAETRPKCHLISLKDLTEVFEGRCLEDIAARPMVIPEFSAGYPGGNAIKSRDYDTTLAEGGYAVNKPSAANMPDGDKKPAAKATSKKRPADDKGMKPAAKKTRKGKKSDESLDASSTAIVPLKDAPKKNAKSAAARKPSKGKKAAASKKKATKAKEPEGKEIEASFEIICDGCKGDCTERSWFVENTEEDFCSDCLKSQGKEGVEQSNGVTVTG
jgi:hypothetical protein